MPAYDVLVSVQLRGNKQARAFDIFHRPWDFCATLCRDGADGTLGRKGEDQ
jgi:hypothetical protein